MSSSRSQRMSGCCRRPGRGDEFRVAETMWLALYFIRGSNNRTVLLGRGVELGSFPSNCRNEAMGAKLLYYFVASCFMDKPIAATGKFPHFCTRIDRWSLYHSKKWSNEGDEEVTTFGRNNQVDKRNPAWPIRRYVELFLTTHEDLYLNPGQRTKSSNTA